MLYCCLHFRKPPFDPKIEMENPSLSKAFIRSDEAGCYHNSLLRASIHGISQRTGVVIERYEFSGPRNLNDIYDRIICPMKQAVRRYCDEGHDIQSAADMRDSLRETTVQGVTASVCEVGSKQKSIDVTKIPTSVHTTTSNSSLEASAFVRRTLWDWVKL